MNHSAIEKRAVKVVIFKVNNFGDNVVFVSAVQALRARCPDWQITLVTTPNESELYGGSLGPQTILACPKPEFNGAYRRPWALARWIWKIRRIKPDACLVAFDQSNVAHLIAKFSGAKIRIGGNLGRIRVEGSLTEEVPMPADARPVTWNWRMAQALARSFNRHLGWPEEPAPPDLSHLLPRGPRPAGPRKRVVVHPGAGGRLNQWPVEHFASVASSLSEEHEVVWISHGRAADRPPAGTTGVCVTTKADLAQWLAGADLFLGNNSGPMHFANALGCPGVAVTGASAMGWDPFWNRDRWDALRHPNLYCAPCEDPRRTQPPCINTENPMACMKYWTPESVGAACRRRLGQEPGRLP